MAHPMFPKEIKKLALPVCCIVFVSCIWNIELDHNSHFVGQIAGQSIFDWTNWNKVPLYNPVFSYDLEN